MKNSHLESLIDHSLDEQGLGLLHQHQIALIITRKKVKNINFRIKAYKLNVSVPYYVSDKVILTAIIKRLDWIISHHQTLLAKQQIHQEKLSDSSLILWGQKQPLYSHQEKPVTEEQKLAIYRQALTAVMPDLFAKWQPIVGKNAKEIRIKKMTTRWGTCNTKAQRIWLSVYLPKHPLECTEYVIVHELCHLHDANHSKSFWQQVEKAMPDYKKWHDLLKN